ncbi:MAG: hypothetical protein ACLQM8_28505 [Limisphaerales bacterium]
MRIFQVSQLVAAFFLGIGQASGVVQVYYYSGPVSGWLEAALAPAPGYGGFVAEFGTLTETLYYDPVAHTLRIAGSITVGPSKGYFDMGNTLDETVGSATLTVGHGGVVSFDYLTTYDGVRFKGTLLVPVKGVGVYEGKRFNRGWHVSIPLDTQIIAVSSKSLTFSQFAFAGGGEAKEVISTDEGDLWDGSSDLTYGLGYNLDSVVASVVPKYWH